MYIHNISVALGKGVSSSISEKSDKVPNCSSSGFTNSAIIGPHDDKGGVLRFVVSAEPREVILRLPQLSIIGK